MEKTCLMLVSCIYYLVIYLDLDFKLPKLFGLWLDLD